MKVNLTDRYVKGLKAERVRVEVGDGVCRGLVIRCAPSGIKTWSFAYKANGKMRRVALGEYPAVSLAQARDEADKRRAQKSAGDDPRAIQVAERQEKDRTSRTFAELCDAYVENYAKLRKSSWKNDEGYLKRPRAKFGSRIASSITKAEIIEFLEKLAQESKASANRTQSVLRTMWGWAVERDYLAANFLAGIKKVGGKEAAKTRVLTADELKAFLAVLADEETRATESVRLALGVVLLTAQRPGEVAGMMRSELHGLDGTEPVWIIPGERTKNGHEHTVPLSPEAVRLIKQALATDEEDDERKNDPAIFASRYESVERLARNSLSRAVARIVEDTEGAIKFTPHDLRRTAATLAQAARVPRDYVKALLNHRDGDVTAVYARHHMLTEKREAVTAIQAAVIPLMPAAAPKAGPVAAKRGKKGEGSDRAKIQAVP